MRAKSVYESISFERGKNTKEALDIGLYPKWKSLKKGDKLSIKKGFNIGSEGEFISWPMGIFNNDSDYIEIAAGPLNSPNGKILYRCFLSDAKTRSNDFNIMDFPEKWEEHLQKIKEIE
jgi:hypothetical protein